jgi:hypothetical protein
MGGSYLNSYSDDTERDIWAEVTLVATVMALRDIWAEVTLVASDDTERDIWAEFTLVATVMALRETYGLKLP